jgi:hypothetical protein
VKKLLPVNRYIFKSVLFFWILLFQANLFAQNPSILQITPMVERDSLQVKISFTKPLFQDESKKAFLAGLPAFLELSIELLNSKNIILNNISFRTRLTYDVWEESFIVRGLSDLSYNFSSFDMLEQWLLPPLKISALIDLENNNNLQANASGRLIMFTTEQNRKLSQIFEEGEQTEESMSFQERSTGFKLNLNRLFNFFLSTKKNYEVYEIKLYSVDFKISDILNK